jgi:hypothetical protein
MFSWTVLPRVMSNITPEEDEAVLRRPSQSTNVVVRYDFETISSLSP